MPSHPSSVHRCSIMAPSAFVLLLGLLGSGSSLPPPRTSFLLNSTIRPLVYFNLPDVHNTTTLLLSDDGSTLYVGARDAVLSLDVSQADRISVKKKVLWTPSDKDIKECERKGKNPAVDCPNFVRVLQLINSTHLYACGSFAFSPRDAFIDAESFSLVQQDGAKGRCPFSPLQRNTAITVDGELFTATTTDFRGVKPQISRHFSRDGRPDVSQDSSVSLLEEPTFVGSSSDPEQRKLYFFFSEVGKEFSFVDDLRIGRVAQVCKDDIGGQRTLQKKWTSFAKASLLCQSPKQLPFSVLRDVFSLRPPQGGDTSDTLFFGVFTSQWSLDPRSAVCVFKLQDIRAAFTGSYRTFDTQTHQWSPLLGKLSYLGRCGLDTASDSDLAEVKKSFLTSSSVRPASDGPVVVSSEHQYSCVAAMRTTAANGKEYIVLFLLTESGFLHKLVFLEQGAQLIEEIQVFTQPQVVKSMVLSSTKGALYVGTAEGVTSVPVANCSMYTTCSQCVLARDPLCGWRPTRGVCTCLDNSPDPIVQALESADVEGTCGQGQTRTIVDTEVSVGVNEVVRLPCLKPSNLAALTWTSTQFSILPQKLFIQSADGSLSFHATTGTFGNYRCETEEGGHREVVVSYNVKQLPSPRSMKPEDREDSFPEDTVNEEVTSNLKYTSTSMSTSLSTSARKDSGTEANFQYDGLNVTLTFRKELRSWSEMVNVTCEVKRNDGAVVVLSLLLVICICILLFGGVYMWRQRKDGRKTKGLVSPEAGPELKPLE